MVCRLLLVSVLHLVMVLVSVRERLSFGFGCDFKL